MLHNPNQRAVVMADERALTQVCGITLLERLLRNLQRIGFRQAHVVCASEKVAMQVSQPSWARSETAVHVLRSGDRLPDQPPFLLVSGSAYHDPRLLRALSEQAETTLLIDSMAGAHCFAALIGRRRPARWQLDFPELAADEGVRKMDVEKQPRYVVDLRREIRPVWFPAGHPDAENLILDAAQNGTLDLPAMLHGPIETAITRRLCRTRITPMQITLFTAAVSLVVVILFARGQLLAGTALALAVGILDGLDGKQARVKVETTELGKREHALDYVLELGWWAALAYHFNGTAQLAHAWALWLLLVGADLVDRFAKKSAKQLTGRNLDDVAPIDRFVRLIGGRRNIYVWMFAAGLALGIPHQSFIALCYWGAATAAVHLLRWLWLHRAARVGDDRLAH